MNDKVIYVRLPVELHRALRLAASSDDRSMSSFVRELLRERLPAEDVKL